MTFNMYAPYAFEKKDADAAAAVGLQPDTVHEAEETLLRNMRMSESIHATYLANRNFLIRLWHESFATKIMTVHSVLQLQIDVDAF
jgi:hypothetical protein